MDRILNTVRATARPTTDNGEDTFHDIRGRVVSRGNTRWEYNSRDSSAVCHAPFNVDRFYFCGHGLAAAVCRNMTLRYDYEPCGAGYRQPTVKWRDERAVTRYYWDDQGRLESCRECNGSREYVFTRSASGHLTRVHIQSTLWPGRKYDISVFCSVACDEMGTPLTLTVEKGPLAGKVFHCGNNRMLCFSPFLSFRFPVGLAGGLVDTDTGLVRIGNWDYFPSLERFMFKGMYGIEQASVEEVLGVAQERLMRSAISNNVPFREEDHTRDNEGKFTSKGGKGKASGKTSGDSSDKASGEADSQTVGQTATKTEKQDYRDATWSEDVPLETGPDGSVQPYSPESAKPQEQEDPPISKPPALENGRITAVDRRRLERELESNASLYSSGFEMQLREAEVKAYGRSGDRKGIRDLYGSHLSDKELEKASGHKFPPTITLEELCEQDYYKALDERSQEILRDHWDKDCSPIKAALIAQKIVREKIIRDLLEANKFSTSETVAHYIALWPELFGDEIIHTLTDPRELVGVLAAHVVKVFQIAKGIQWGLKRVIRKAATEGFDYIDEREKSQREHSKRGK